jgi:hypothetical protein
MDVRTRVRRLLMVGVELGAVGLLCAGLVLAQGSGFNLAWWSVDGGGGISAGGSLRLSGSSGQAEAAAAQAMTGGNYVLRGGFWSGALAGAAPPPSVRSVVHLPLLLK